MILYSEIHFFGIPLSLVGEGYTGYASVQRRMYVRILHLELDRATGEDCFL